MRVPTNIISQTNVYARYLCEDKGFFKLTETNGTLAVDTNVTAQALAEMLVPPGVAVANVMYTGHVAARGVFSNANDCGLPIENGVILSSGSIADAVGTNNSSGGDLPGSILETSGDADLSSMVGGGATLDAAVLEFDVYSSNSVTLTFQYFFTSEEYPEWIDQYNDPMAIFVTTNRVGNVWTNTPDNNIALVPCTNVFVGIGTINGGSLEDIIAATNGLYYLDNNDPDPIGNAVAPYAVGEAVFDFQYDGMTMLLLAEVEIAANVTNRVKVAVADFAGVTGDRDYDSAVFIRSWTSDRCQ